jgi:EAL domain-containing protein (putative c-di-GMP-specific phosphodiesterase class I)
MKLLKILWEIAHPIGKETIGEFVENAEILEQFNEIGVDYGQGYHLHVPCNMQSLIDGLQAKHANG